MVYLITALVLFAITGIFILRFTGITLNGLPVLMYHKVTDLDSPDDLTISTQQLEKQFNYLSKKKYTAVFLSDLLDYVNHNRALPPKPVLLSFDDGYKNNYTYLYPLLKKYGLKGNIFLVAGFIKSAKDNDTDQSDYLNVDDIGKMSSDVVEFGLHSYDHKSYNDLTIPQIEEDIVKCRARLDQLNIAYQPCLAYTYGAYPKKDTKKRNQLFGLMKANGIQLGFRIGNRLNKFPLRNKFLLQRIDVRGDESFSKFKLILFAGKKILFR